MTAIEGLQPGTWTIDPAHSEVAFVIRHLAISKVRGAFERFEGTIQVGEQLEDTTVSATVDVASITTKQAQRDEHLRNSDYFAADRYPQIAFVSKSVRVDDGGIVVLGDFTMRGVTKEVELEVEFGGVTVDGFGNTKAGFEAETKISRKEFGVSGNAPTEAGGLALGDEVRILIDGQAALQA
ncbi:YceI family protein [Gulosibacter sp. 10]|uniref:YceI family protein n=1 Tax=Gulosibacter sp. 10 TaxID=1255570 RepID=UPI00097E908D|nr:YceI family protein [Gulosibacter sp. 10]SJM67491.1 Protein yceI precursor [Gulosibacter sp. 10]